MEAKNFISTAFPHGITMDECREAIKGANGFRECHKDDYIIFNYDYSFRGSFPHPNEAQDEKQARLFHVRRECRGLIFDHNGNILARRFHKFFNINELPETEEHKIDINRPYFIIEKVDGCLVSPFYTQGKLRWGTKMGLTSVTDEIERFVAENKLDYVGFSNEWINKGYTPLFEWCSLSQQIVISYDVTQLVITSIRHNHTGDYLPYKQMVESAKAYNIPVVDTTHAEGSNAAELLVTVKKLENIEGFILNFDNGEMFKMKCDWYIQRSKKMAGEFTGHEKDIWLLVLDNKLDDLGEALGHNRKQKIEEFGIKLMAALEQRAAEINAVVEDAKKRGLTKKEFVDEMNQKNAGNGDSEKMYKTTYYRVFDGADAFDTIVDVIKKSCNTASRLDIARKTYCPELSIKL
jgi:RNA ligase